ncbi:hypothetical protein AB0K51_20325 [Kitasatospora sp. NPDC049285]|uniref:hypothetical protein n=1 Tax=Kitasatospora sp. NPDC049285 TaxID=3157096 RepID=UPI003412122C
MNRELSVVRKAIGWWLRQGWITTDPTFGIERRPSPPDKTKAICLARVTAVRRPEDVSLRDKTLWRPPPVFRSYRDPDLRQPGGHLGPCRAASSSSRAGVHAGPGDHGVEPPGRPGASG